MAAGAVLLYASGVLLGYPLLVVVAVGGLAMLGLAGLAVAVPSRVTLTRQVTPRRVTVGEAALGRLDIHNTSRWPAPPFTAVDRVGAQSVDLDIAVLPGGGRRAVHYPVPAGQRGRLRLGPLTVARRDPLGLVSRAQPQTADDVLWVHPRTHPVRPLPVGVVLDYEGRITENARPGTVTFSSLREYVPGDDPRQIHWRSTARAGTLIVRQHVDTAEPTTTVVLDTRAAALDADAFEHAVEVTASVAQTTAEHGHPVSLYVLDEDSGAALAAGAQSVLDRLALAGRTEHRDPLRLLDLVERVPAGGALVVVTGGQEPTVLARLAEQRRRFTPVVVVSVLGAADPAGAGIRRRPGLTVLAVRTGSDAAATWNRMIAGELG